MNLSEFISRLFNRYKCTAPDIEDKKEEITGVLIAQSEKIDFQKLLDLIAKRNETDFLPAGSKILEWSKSCYKQEYKKGSGGWIYVKMKTPPDFGKKYGNGGNIDVFPSGWSDEKILNYYKKRFGGEGWRIEELNYA